MLGVDITGFWRPKLHGWMGKHFHSLAQRALPAVVLGVMTLSGEVDKQRIPLLRRLVRCQPEVGKADFRLELLKAAKAVVQADEVIVVDAEFEISELHVADIERYVVRLANNATARRNQLPEYKGRGRWPEYGERVRPLPRRWKERQIAATAPDHETQFVHDGRTIQVAIWWQQVPVDTKVDPLNKTFAIYAYTDPAYKTPLLLATNLTCAADIPYLMYRDRWPVEQAPLSAKQMIGLHRSFVFFKESCFRLPELALFAGNMLTYLAATLPPLPDRFLGSFAKTHPRSVTQGCCNRLIFQSLPLLSRYFEKRTRSLTIYPRAAALMFAKNVLHDPLLPETKVSFSFPLRGASCAFVIIKILEMS
ncbi:MAG: hypothetical protein R2873_05725 [Caldilineaceae bacterium]